MIKNAFYGVMLNLSILQKSIQEKLKKVDEKIAEKHDYSEIEFPVKEKDFDKIEVQNNISINVLAMRIT